MEERRARALTPDDIVNYPLKQAVRGYSVRQVDDLLDRVADEFERIHHELAETRERLERAEARAEALSEVESTLKRTLVTAQRAAEQTIAEARERAATVVEQAHQEAERKERAVIGSARAELDELRRNQRELAVRIEALRAFERDYRSTLRNFVERHLRALDELQQRVPPSLPPEAESAVAEAVGEWPQREEEPAGPEPGEMPASPRHSPAAEVASPSRPERVEASTAEQEIGGTPTPETPITSPQAPAAVSSTPSASLPESPGGKVPGARPSSSEAVANEVPSRPRSEAVANEVPSPESARSWPSVDLSGGEERLRWLVESAFAHVDTAAGDEEDVAVRDQVVGEDLEGEAVIIYDERGERGAAEPTEDGSGGEGV